jgi:hypothetical protein
MTATALAFAPLYRNRPAHRWTNGDIAAKVGADLGIPPDPEQQWLLDTIFAESAPNRPASFEVVTIAARQNIKTSTFGVAALADLFVFGIQKHLWSAHLDDTAEKTFSDFQRWIRSNPEYDDQVQFYDSHQDRSIVRRDTGASIEFGSRTGKRGRGATGVERLTLDESLYLEASHIGAVYPTMLTQPGAQVRVLSSAGVVGSAQLRLKREQGRKGTGRRMAYVEYGAERRPCEQGRGCAHAVGTPGCALDDRELWWQANPALWSGRINEDALVTQREAMPPEEFAREFLSWWEDPESVGGALPYAAWVDLADPNAARGSTVSFGVDVAEDRSAWVAVAWTREDGTAQVMLTNGGRSMQPGDLPVECARLSSEWGGFVVPPKAFAEEIEQAGTMVVPLKAGEFTAGCGAIADRVTAGTVHHGNQHALNVAVKAARWRSAGTTGERAFQLKDFPEVGPLAAVVRALCGLTALAAEEPAIY